MELCAIVLCPISGKIKIPTVALVSLALFLLETDITFVKSQNAIVPDIMIQLLLLALMVLNDHC